MAKLSEVQLNLPPGITNTVAQPLWNGRLSGQLLRFALVGIGNTIIDILILNLLLFCFPTQTVGLLILYNSVAYTIGAINSFFLNKYWTFHDKKKAIKGELLRFALVNIAGILCNNCILWLIASVSAHMGLNPTLWANLSKILAISGTSALSFLGMRLWVFAYALKKGEQGASIEN